MSVSNRIALTLTVIFLFVAVIVVVQQRYVFCVQYDKSVYFKLGLLDKYDKIPVKGQYAAFVFYAVANDRYGQQFVKKVACTEGEYLTVLGRDFYCNNEYIGTAKEKDRKGNPASLYQYKGVVEKGKFFSIGEMIDSYDSKYWGFVDNSWMIGRVIKLF